MKVGQHPRCIAKGCRRFAKLPSRACLAHLAEVTLAYRRARDSKERSRKKYYLLKAHGICVQCHARPARKNKVRCAVCVTKGRAGRLEYEKQRYKAQKARGQCVRSGCTRLALLSDCRCMSCKATDSIETTTPEYRRKRRERRQRRKDAGVCTDCGGVRDDWRLKCAKCRSYHREYMRRRRANNDTSA